MTWRRFSIRAECWEMLLEISVNPYNWWNNQRVSERTLSLSTLSIWWAQYQKFLDVKWVFLRSVPVLNNLNQIQPCVQQHCTYSHESVTVGVRTTYIVKRPKLCYLIVAMTKKTEYCTIQSIDIIVYLLYLK